jgi:hypothetical protein
MDLARPVECPILIGRDGLLALAEDQLRAVAGGGGMLLLAGEPGIGKTRLAGAISRKAETLGFRLAGGALAPQDLQVPAALFLDLARTAARRPGFGELGPCLLELLRDVPVTSRSSPRQRRRLVVFDAVGLIADAADAPTFLVFEDLQWADELSLEILGELARRSRDLPLLIVATYRTTPEVGGSALGEWRARLMTQRLAGELRLEPLSMDQTADMTRLILGSDLPPSRELVAAVYERTDGIPLHVEELIGVAASGGRLDEGAIRNATVPNTIEDAIRHRLGQRSSSAQRLAQAGAVIGRSFLPAIVAAVMEVPVEELDEPLQELVDYAFLGPRGPRAHTTSGTSSCATRSTTAFPRRSEDASTSAWRRSETSSRAPHRSTPLRTSSWRGIVERRFAQPSSALAPPLPSPLIGRHSTSIAGLPATCRRKPTR